MIPTSTVLILSTLQMRKASVPRSDTVTSEVRVFIIKCENFDLKCSLGLVLLVFYEHPIESDTSSSKIIKLERKIEESDGPIMILDSDDESYAFGQKSKPKKKLNGARSNSPSLVPSRNSKQTVNCIIPQHYEPVSRPRKILINPNFSDSVTLRSTSS